MKRRFWWYTFLVGGVVCVLGFLFLKGKQLDLTTKPQLHVDSGITSKFDGTSNEATSTADRMLGTIQEGIRNGSPSSFGPRLGATTFDSSRLTDIRYRTLVRRHLLLKKYYETDKKDGPEFIQLKQFLSEQNLKPNTLQMIYLFNQCYSIGSHNEYWDKINPELFTDHDHEMQDEIMDRYNKTIRRYLKEINPDISEEKIKSVAKQLQEIRPLLPFVESKTPLKEGDLLLVN